MVGKATRETIQGREFGPNEKAILRKRWDE